MKVCFPVKTNQGVESIPYRHFRTAPMFVMCDLNTNEIRTIGSDDMNHQYGICKPLRALKSESIDAVIVKDIGLGTIIKLRSLGIKVYRAHNCTISENIVLFTQGKLREFSNNYLYWNEEYQIS